MKSSHPIACVITQNVDRRRLSHKEGASDDLASKRAAGTVTKRRHPGRVKQWAKDWINPCQTAQSRVACTGDHPCGSQVG